jgi:hypothetical protein
MPPIRRPMPGGNSRMVVIDPVTRQVVGNVRRSDAQRLMVAGEIQRHYPGRQDDFSWVTSAEESVERGGMSSKKRPLDEAPEGNRGSTLVLAPPAVSPGSITSLTGVVVETPKDGGENGESIIITLGLDRADGQDRENSPNQNMVDAVCVLEWGVGGSNFIAEIDWSNGLAFSIAGSYARVAARYDCLQVDVAEAPVPLRFKAGFAYGDRSSQSQALRRSQPITDRRIEFDDELGTSTGYLIPEFATTMQLLVQNYALGTGRSLRPYVDFNLEFFGQETDASFPLSMSYHVASYNNLTHADLSRQFTIPNSARKFRLTNNCRSENLATFSAVYNLSL